MVGNLLAERMAEDQGAIEGSVQSKNGGLGLRECGERRFETPERVSKTADMNKPRTVDVAWAGWRWDALRFGYWQLDGKLQQYSVVRRGKADDRGLMARAQRAAVVTL